MIDRLFALLFGSGGRSVRDTVEIFRENSEKSAQRGHDLTVGALAQFAAEFEGQRVGVYDRFVDAVNRLPRPALAFGTLGLFVSAMLDPVWFAARMQGIALVPEPLWWLLGAIVSFYFGARHQAKSQDFHRGIAATIARTPSVVQNLRDLDQLDDERDGNPALEEWRKASR